MQAGLSRRHPTLACRLVQRSDRQWRVLLMGLDAAGVSTALRHLGGAGPIQTSVPYIGECRQVHAGGGLPWLDCKVSLDPAPAEPPLSAAVSRCAHCGNPEQASMLRASSTATCTWLP